MRLCILARHGESDYNVQGRLNGDPSVAVALSPRGCSQARKLGVYVAQVPLDICLHTRFPRTLQTACLALSASHARCPMACEARLDDIDVGDFEGRPAANYRAWKTAHPRDEAAPGGESIRDAVLRYSAALRSLCERPEELVLVVCHELPLRYTVNAARGSADISGPERNIANAAPYLFDAESLRRAAAHLEVQANAAWARERPTRARG